MNVLILNQKVSDSYIDIIQNALPEGTGITLITGSHLERHEYVPAPPHDPDSLKSRLICWIKYYRFVLKWVKKHQNSNFDFVFATSNPPVNGYLGVKLKKILNTKFIYMNWDLYPQVIETGMSGIVPRILSKCWHFVNERIYPKIDRMVTIGNVMAETINEPLKTKIPISVIPMFTDTEIIKPIPKGENDFCINNGLTDKFIVLYSGKMGIGHNIELLLEASRYTAYYKNILYLFIGHGQKYRYVEKWIEDNQPQNVVLMPLQSEDVFPLSITSGDIGYISQEKSLARCFMPAKTFDMMAAGMGLLAFSEGTDDLSNLVRREELGIVITEDDPQKLAEIIIDLHNDSDRLRVFSEKSRNLAVSDYDAKIITEQYGRLFSEFKK